jgi:hypothetical protein
VVIIHRPELCVPELDQTVKDRKRAIFLFQHITALSFLRAAKGIGKAIAGRLAHDGFTVIVADVDEPAAITEAAVLSGMGIGVDVSDSAAAKRMDLVNVCRLARWSPRRGRRLKSIELYKFRDVRHQARDTLLGSLTHCRDNRLHIAFRDETLGRRGAGPDLFMSYRILQFSRN